MSKPDLLSAPAAIDFVPEAVWYSLADVFHEVRNFRGGEIWLVQDDLRASSQGLPARRRGGGVRYPARRMRRARRYACRVGQTGALHPTHMCEDLRQLTITYELTSEVRFVTDPQRNANEDVLKRELRVPST